VPTTKLPAWVLLIDRSTAVIVVGSFADLSPATESPGSDTVTLLVTGEAVSAAAPTVTVKVMVLALPAPVLIGPAFVQVTI